MAEEGSSVLTRFEEFRQRGIEALQLARVEEAAGLFDAALALAEELGEQNLIDRAFCGRSAAALEMGQGAEVVQELRQILVRNTDSESCFLAAYNVARAYEMRKENRKALFYARIARDHASRLGRRDWLASSHNQIGNLLLADSFFEDACRSYAEALELLPAAARVEKALIFDNLGYCAVIDRRFGEAFSLLFRSLRTLRRLSARRYQTLPHLALCLAYLEIERFGRAERHGMEALALAEEEKDRESVKNALYLLGEVANLAGDSERAHDLFRRLQVEFYPDAGFLPHFLLAIDVRKLVNLRA